jgi:hypothetical protein
MGYVLNETGLTTAFDELVRSYRLYAPVLKQGEGRFEGPDVVRYDFVTSAGIARATMPSRKFSCRSHKPCSSLRMAHTTKLSVTTPMSSYSCVHATCTP